MRIIVCALWFGVAFTVPTVTEKVVCCDCPKKSEALALNLSTDTKDAEEDNVNVCLFKPGVRRYRITATLPQYKIGKDNCKPNFSNTPPAAKEAKAQRPDMCTKLFDDGMHVLELCVVDQWWRGKVMQVTTPTKVARGHYLRLYKKILDEDEWPQYLVLYQDGNLRLINHPPKGRKSVCFGSSVIIGPAKPAKRPFADIQHVVFIPSKQSVDLFVFYCGGQGAAHLIASVNRDAGVVTVENVRYHANERIPFATFRSMYVSDGNSDVDRITVGNKTQRILGWQRLQADTWFFHRVVRSKHNTSAPDLKIEILD